MMSSEGAMRVTVAICSRRTEAGYVVSSFDECTTVVIASTQDKLISGAVSLDSTSSQPRLDKVAKIREASPTAVIASEIDPYSLVSLSAKGIEVRLVDDGVAVEAALQLYRDNKAHLACGVVRPTKN